MSNVKHILCFVPACIIGLQGHAQELSPNPNLEEVIVVFKTHFDIGYTYYAESVVHKYGSSMIEGALENLEASRQLPAEERFVWTLPGWPMQQILEWSNPATKGRVEEALRTGSFVVHGLPFTIETEASDLENIVRGLRLSRNICEKYGLELPRDAKMTDVPSHSWVLPTILTHAGIDFLHLGCNPASQSPNVPLLFWWEGPDGTRLMTMYNPVHYGTALVAPPDWLFKTWIALVLTGDNQGAPAPSQVEQTMIRIRELAPNARITTGRMSDFYDALMKEEPDLPVVRGDMPDTWIHGYMSMPREMKTSRRMQRDLYALESLNAQLNNWTGTVVDIADLVDRASVNNLLFDEHTFGLAMSHGHSGVWAYGDDYRLMEAEGTYEPIERSWQDKGDRIYASERKVRPHYADELERLSMAIATDKNHITVYNPLPWDRSGVVRLQIASSRIDASALQDAGSGEYIPLVNSDNVVSFRAKDVPSMGYKTYLPVRRETMPENALRVDREEHTIENEYFIVQMDPARGGIGSVVDKRSGRELVMPGSAYGFGNYFYERFSKEQVDQYANAYIKGGWNWAPAELGRPGLDDTPYSAHIGAQARLSYQESALEIKAVMHIDEGPDSPHDYSIIVSLYAGVPYIELRWAIHSKPAEPWPEAGWIPFSVNVHDPDFKVGRLGAVVDPSADYVDNTNFDYFFLNSGVAILDEQGKGVGISSPDAPGVSLDRPGLWRFSGKFEPEKPVVFFNLFNNQWSTNFTEWIEGSWNVRFHIWSIDDYDNEKGLVTPSEEFRSPLLAAFAPGRNGDLPVQDRGVSLSRKGVLVTAFGAVPGGGPLLLRCWEQTGTPGDVVVTIPHGLNVSHARPVNLRGEKSGAEIPIAERTFTFTAEAWKPYTFLLE